MAVNTDNFGFKKPDESDFYDVQDQNNNWDIADRELEKLNNPTFEDYIGDASAPEAVTAIEALKSKSKIGTLLSNIKAAFKGACLIGHIVNNCVTDNPNLPLSAAQGKALQDQLATLNSNLMIPDYKNAIDVMAAVYTASKNGYIIVQLRANGNNQGCSINNITVCQMYSYTVNGQPITIHTVPIAKGDIAKILSEDKRV